MGEKSARWSLEIYPIIFEVGPVTFHAYGLLVALGIFLGLRVGLALARKDGADSKEAEDSLHQLFFYLVLGGLLGGRIAYILIYWRDYAGDIFGIFRIWEGGLVSYGGLLGLAVGFFLWQRGNKIAPWLRVVDWLAPAITVAHATGRLGCFFAGCCYGIPTGKWWGIVFRDERALSPLHVPLHPTQIYEFIFLTTLGIFLWQRFSHAQKSAQRKDGTIFTDYLTIYPAGRFVIEFYRDERIMFFHLTSGQWMSISVFATSFILRAFLTRKTVSANLK